MSYDPESSYYDYGGIETIEIIRAKLTAEQFEGFCLGNALKYVSRANHKHESKKRDIQKAINYLNMIMVMGG